MAIFWRREFAFELLRRLVRDLGREVLGVKREV